MLPTAEHLRPLDALKALYEAQLGTLKALSERSFSTTLQALTLNVGVVAGLIGSKANLSSDGKNVATWLLLVFHFLVVSYLISKSRSHHREKVKLEHVQMAIAEMAGMRTHFGTATGPSYVRSFFGGTGLFASTVVVAGACSIYAVHRPMLA
ncbi:MAG: hypothetical protein J0M20_09205 [Burkholderiales bacterium]|nr:hypothetical protein [Burkholderiales bacterium]